MADYSIFSPRQLLGWWWCAEEEEEEEKDFAPNGCICSLIKTHTHAYTYAHIYTYTHAHMHVRHRSYIPFTMLGWRLWCCLPLLLANSRALLSSNPFSMLTKNCSENSVQSFTHSCVFNVLCQHGQGQNCRQSFCECQAPYGPKCLSVLYALVWERSTVVYLLQAPMLQGW